MSKRQRRSASSLDALFDVATEAMGLSRGGGDHGGPHLIPIRQVQPDPLQARRLLPPAVRAGFVTGQLDPPGALAAWRALAEDDPRESDLLQSQVINLAVSIRQQELVNPITVYPDGPNAYRLETGERRWWAHWWLVSVEERSEFEMIRAQVVPAANPARQAAENLQDSPLTAVQEACQVARLLLHLTRRDDDHVVAISAGGQVLVGYDHARAALELERSEVYGKWAAVSQIMGRGERQLLRQLAILKLDDRALDLADRAGLTEGQLRALVSQATELSPERQLKILSLAARYDLPGAEVARLVSHNNLEVAEARIRRQLGLDRPAEPERPPTAIRRPATILVERLRKVRLLVARQQKAGATVADLAQEIVQAGQADALRQELDELTDLLIQLREHLV